MAVEVFRLPKGEQRRRAIVQAAAELLREEGPSGVTHRKVAARAGASLSATTYYFTGLDDLLGQAAALNFKQWVGRARGVADELSAEGPPQSSDVAIDAILRACLPASENLENHYVQLVAATAYPTVTSEYSKSRDALNAAIGEVLKWAQCPISPELILAVVDGGAVEAISEGRDVRETARGLVRELFNEVGIGSNDEPDRN